MNHILTMSVFFGGLLAVAATSLPAQHPGNRLTQEQAWQLGWPAVHGPFGNFVAPQTGLKMIDDLAQARKLWKSEENDFGQGTRRV